MIKPITSNDANELAYRTLMGLGIAWVIFCTFMVGYSYHEQHNQTPVEVNIMYHEPLADGAQLKSVWWGTEALGYTTDTEYEDSIYYAKTIEVVTVYGQMARVPWAKVTLKDGTIKMVNLALVEVVTLMKEEPNVE
ncbi:MAG: hypothetical protein DRP42_06225 [Tenericutes bacterium]|nr:MAG: hypothetical protein DRP42_06225 [Mycoplasmatota bacterium]